MADYRRKTHSRSKSRKRKSSSLVWVWIFMGMFIGIAITTSSYLFFTKPNLLRLVRPLATESAPSPKYIIERSAKKEKEKKAAERFEFYTLLPGMEIQLPDLPAPKQQATLSQPQPAPTTPQSQKPAEPVMVVVRPQTPPQIPSSAPIVTPKPIPPKFAIRPPIPSSSVPNSAKGQVSRYIIQVGIFQNIQQADELKARLTLQGFTTRIQKVQMKTGQSWFRVTLGPFASESNALNQKNRLAQQQIRGILILQRPNG